MSKAIQCNQCGNTLTLDKRGEDEAGEMAAWLRLEIANDIVDLCTRACLHEFIDRPEIIAAHDAQYEAIADIARLIRDERRSA